MHFPIPLISSSHGKEGMWEGGNCTIQEESSGEKLRKERKDESSEKKGKKDAQKICSALPAITMFTST
jgi:hypothetical protein